MAGRTTLNLNLHRRLNLIKPKKCNDVTFHHRRSCIQRKHIFFWYGLMIHSIIMHNLYFFFEYITLRLDNSDVNPSWSCWKSDSAFPLFVEARLSENQWNQLQELVQWTQPTVTGRKYGESWLGHHMENMVFGRVFMGSHHRTKWGIYICGLISGHNSVTNFLHPTTSWVVLGVALVILVASQRFSNQTALSSRCTFVLVLALKSE